MKHSDQNYALYHNTGGGRDIKTESGSQDGKYWEDTDGLVETPHGYVIIRKAFFQDSYSMSSLEMIKDGRKYYRRFKKQIGRNYLVTLAKRFSKELFE
jgi:hypothetical protein